jgi:alanyl-tRNA synthetase
VSNSSYVVLVWPRANVNLFGAVQGERYRGRPVVVLAVAQLGIEVCPGHVVQRHTAIAPVQVDRQHVNGVNALGQVRQSRLSLCP